MHDGVASLTARQGLLGLRPPARPLRAVGVFDLRHGRGFGCSNDRRRGWHSSGCWCRLDFGSYTSGAASGAAPTMASATAFLARLRVALRPAFRQARQLLPTSTAVASSATALGARPRRGFLAGASASALRLLHRQQLRFRRYGFSGAPPIGISRRLHLRAFARCAFTF